MSPAEHVAWTERFMSEPTPVAEIISMHAAYRTGSFHEDDSGMVRPIDRDGAHEHQEPGVGDGAVVAIGVVAGVVAAPVNLMAVPVASYPS